MVTRRQRLCSYRRQSGQGLTEGVAGLLLVTTGIVLGVLLLVNSGLLLFYKEKLAFVTDQTAKFAATLSSDTRDDDTEKFAKELLGKVGLPSKQATVKVDDTTLAGQAAVSVAITDNFGLFGNGEILPKASSLTDVAVCLGGGDANQPIGLLQIAPGDTVKPDMSKSIFVPIVKPPKIIAHIETNPPTPIFKGPPDLLTAGYLDPKNAAKSSN
jgi:hypothetical protein